MQMSETTTTTRKTRYSTQAPDGSQMIGEVGDESVTITYGGTSLVAPLDAMPAVVALAATMSAAIAPVQSVPDDGEDELPVEEPPAEEPPA